MEVFSNKKVLNFNIGVLGHIDSGKTSLAKALSSTASTASFDKNPQSKERGITLDLGFSSFQVPMPEHLKGHPYDLLQFTLVDCPGHASLIRTIIGGAQIIDMMMLVVDVTKGVQTQTAECLVIGEILCEKMVVVLNKTDLLKEEKRNALVEKMSKKLSKTLENTKFVGSPIVAVSAKPGGPDSPDSEPIGSQKLVDLLSSMSYFPNRDPSGPLVYAVDHCFSIRGQGTVMTGTILSGSVKVNDNVEIPSMKITKKVKSMQMFKVPVTEASQGDRVGICVTQFDPKLLERGLVCSPATVPTIFAAITTVKHIPYYKGAITSKAKFHITIGHETVMGKLQVFGVPPGQSTDTFQENSTFDMSREYIFQEAVLDRSKRSADSSENENAYSETNCSPLTNQQWLFIEFEKPVTCPENSLVIGSRLDTDIHLNICRIAFHGRLVVPVVEKNFAETLLPQLKIYKTKTREGVVERIPDDYSVIAHSLFKKETNIQSFVGMKIRLSTGEEGMIEGAFGQSGKVKIRIPKGLSADTVLMHSSTGKKKGGKNKSALQPSTAEDMGDSLEKLSKVIKVILEFKRYNYDPKKKMVQS
ncbi:selenocysteine-specific elongation factor-like [Montipora capricornis]|uniref:selenocysteine-specific elongation factor-like n=1 Tax=Montipora capricornis TaxID=246305 RepID=UPI0035F1208D